MQSPLTPLPHLLGLRPEDLAGHLGARGVGVDAGELRRLLAHVISGGCDDLDVPGGVARSLRQAVSRLTRAEPLQLVERAADPRDGFVKYLFRSPDGALSEAVRIPLGRDGRYTVCLSSQVGCAMGCVYCATGRMGLQRHLEAWEMVAAFRAVRAELGGAGHLGGAVFMGQGEPLHNYEQVIQAARVLAHPCGGRIRQRAISISTAGLVPQIRRYSREGHRYRLIVSLTSAIAARRQQLMPGAARHGLDELAAALREHARARGQRVTIAWVVLGGVNTGADEVAALERLLGDVPLRINLIDVNGASGAQWRRATPQELAAFVDELQRLGAPVVRRYSGGAARHAACGMLSARRLGDETTSSRDARLPTGDGARRHGDAGTRQMG